MLVVEFITYASPDISGLPMIFIALALAFALAGAMVVTTVLGHADNGAADGETQSPL